MARLVFLDESTIALYPEWERVARETVAFLRRDSVHDLDDPQLAELIGELSLKSPSFRRWWNSREVKDKASGTKRFNHPLVGEFELRHETLYPGGSDSQALVIYMAEPGTPAHTSLGLLATIANPQDPEQTQDQRGNADRERCGFRSDCGSLTGRGACSRWSSASTVSNAPRGR